MSLAESAARAAAPLSVAQEALWYRSLMSPMGITYNEAISISYDGPLDAAAFRRAFNEIVRRHEAWRTTFAVVDGQPVQIVGSPPDFALPLLDLSALTEDQAEQRAVTLVAELARVPYDVRHGPLVRPRLIRLRPDHHRLYLAMHHLVFDGVSLTRIVLPELARLYEHYRGGRVDRLPEAAHRYEDFARWEQEWITAPRIERRVGYWRAHLQHAPALALPHDHPRTASSGVRGAALPLSIPARTVDQLSVTGQHAGATLFQVLAAGWSLLLSRYTGQEDVTFATAADLRQRPEFQMVVGCCVTPLVLRVDLAGDPSFADLVRRLRNELLDALDQMVPFERLVRALHPEPGANPIYQAMMIMEPASDVADPAWSVTQVDSRLADAVGAVKLDLELQLDQRPAGDIIGSLIYDRSLFEPATIARMVVHLQRLLGLAAADPGLPVSRFEMLTPSERDRLLVEWNATASELPPTSIRELVGARASRQPAAAAIVDGERLITYGELEHEMAEAMAATDGPGHGGVAANLAVALAAELGIGVGDTVLILPAMLKRDPLTALWMPIVAGASVLIAAPELAADGRRLGRVLGSGGVTVVHAAPSEWQALIDGGLRPVRGLRALTGGEPLSRDLADRILTRCRVLWNAFRAPGTSGYCTLAPVGPIGTVTIGRPLANLRAYVVDRHIRPAPIGVIGELLVGGDLVSAAGSAFSISDTIADPLGAGDVLRTGQRARWHDNGQLEWVLGPAGPRAEATTGIEPV